MVDTKVTYNEKFEKMMEETHQKVSKIRSVFYKQEEEILDVAGTKLLEVMLEGDRASKDPTGRNRTYELFKILKGFHDYDSHEDEFDALQMLGLVTIGGNHRVEFTEIGRAVFKAWNVMMERSKLRREKAAQPQPTMAATSGVNVEAALKGSAIGAVLLRLTGGELKEDNTQLFVFDPQAIVPEESISRTDQ
ncbi:MAG: hypothetical protein M1504_03930 [Candidatus Marsarchaeota archaeon]|nr:hypothetical protein [Candidatus Marsarchaeota archaeon]